MNDRQTIGTITIGALIFYLFVSMVQTPDTSQPIYYVNYTSGNNTTYINIDYILVNVSINDSGVNNPTGIRIDLYDESGALYGSITKGVWE